jgi:hypothetical protein
MRKHRSPRLSWWTCTVDARRSLHDSIRSWKHYVAWWIELGLMKRSRESSMYTLRRTSKCQKHSPFDYSVRKNRRRDNVTITGKITDSRQDFESIWLWYVWSLMKFTVGHISFLRVETFTTQSALHTGLYLMILTFTCDITAEIPVLRIVSKMSL